ncbi:MAG: hypothetical protein ACRDMV_05605 [Streptosporangiales bacterium]
MTDSGAVTLRLSAEELAALDALTAGIGVLAEREIGTDAAVVAATELGLTRLLEDFELPDEAVRERVSSARDGVRTAWSRGNACL